VERRFLSRNSRATALTRQGVTKHLQVLERAVWCTAFAVDVKVLFRFDPKPVRHAQDFLTRVAGQLDEAVLGLKSLVES
jgi:hypothetical protein